MLSCVIKQWMLYIPYETRPEGSHIIHLQEALALSSDRVSLSMNPSRSLFVSSGLHTLSTRTQRGLLPSSEVSCFPAHSMMLLQHDSS